MHYSNNKYFTQLLNIANFFKLVTINRQIMIPQSIKLATFDEILANIEQSKFQTQLIKDMLCFLLHHKATVKAQSYDGTNVVNLLHEDLSIYRQKIIDQCYLQLALQQTVTLHQHLQSKEKYCNISRFCQLDRETKYTVLNTLVKQMDEQTKIPGSKNKKDNEQDEQDKPNKDGQKKNQKNNVNFKQILVLGDDSQQMYMFIPFIPEYIFSIHIKSWKAYDRKQILLKLNKLLKYPPSTSMLYLIQNLTAMVDQFMKIPSKKAIRVHHAKIQNNQKDEVEGLKNYLLVFEQKYSRVLSTYENHVYAGAGTRKKFGEGIKNAKTLGDILEAMTFFYNQTCGSILKFTTQTEEEISPHQESQLYVPVKKVTLNINKLRLFCRNPCILMKDIAQSMIDEDRIDRLALMKIYIFGLDSPLRYIERKAKQFQKRQERIISQKASRCSSVDEPEKQENSKMQLRERKAKKNAQKKGAMLIDSDSESQFTRMRSSISAEFKKYALRSYD